MVNSCASKMCWSKTTSKHFIFLFLFITSYVSANINEDLIVETKVGRIRGLRDDEGNYAMFLGIPYATVDRSNIFGSSIPQEPFEGVFEAYDDSSKCPQIEEFNSTTVGTLDCLNLNIHVPDSASSQNPLPVMVYIYGGGFNIGFSGRFLLGPKFLVRHDVILVTFNYRLGVYGFMCLDTPEVPGNAGLKDIVNALRWVQRNIESFGGDPNKVTLFGNSAGGMANGLLLISETEKLFNNLIMQSGSEYMPGIISRANLNAPLALAAELNFATENVIEAISFLSSADVHAVVEASAGISFNIVEEKEFPGVERFISEYAINSNYSKVADVAILLGYNNAEAMGFTSASDDPEIWQMWEQMFESNLRPSFDFEDPQFYQLSRLVRRFYLGDEEMNNEVRTHVTDFSGDFMFVYPSIRSIEAYINAGAQKVYQYVFSYEGQRNFVKVKNNITLPGAAHADEIGYLFSMNFIPETPTIEDQLIIDRMTTMWTNFAKYSDPTPQTNTLLPVKWEPITTGSPYHYIEINTEMTANMRYQHRKMTFWDLFFKAYGNYEKGYKDPNSPVPSSSVLLSFNRFMGFFVFMISIIFML